MKVLFVCTGNICRSPMGELMFPLFFYDSSIEMDSAGTQGLDEYPIDPSSAKLLSQDGINSSTFRSKRLTPKMVLDSDLVLCFTEHQRKKIVSLAPRARTKVFVLTDFANLCNYCAQNNLVEGDTMSERLTSVIDNASMLKPVLPPAQDIADPYRKDFEAFQTAHDQIAHAISRIAIALEGSRAAHAA